MKRISPNNPVRRRLVFGEDDDDHTRVENFTNKFRESIDREVEEKSKKWGFDFRNETSLNGNYLWCKRVDGTWVGVRNSATVTGIRNDKITDMKFNNENTPPPVRNTIAPVIKSRKSSVEQQVPRQSVKRKMDFDDASFVTRRCCSNS